MKDSDWAFLRQLYLTPNITKAASALFISQPALTKRLQYIEDEMNVQIVYRSKSGLDFTTEGMYLAKQALKYMDFMEETRRHLDMLRSNHHAIISIGASLSYLKFKLPQIVSDYTSLHPDVRFDIIGGRSRTVHSMVDEGTVDIGIIRGRTSESVEKIQINSEKGYILTSTPLESLESLAWTPRIDYPLNDYCRQIVDNWWSEHFPSAPVVGMTVEHMDQSFPMVSHSLGYTIAFLPDGCELPPHAPVSHAAAHSKHGFRTHETDMAYLSEEKSPLSASDRVSRLYSAKRRRENLFFSTAGRSPAVFLAEKAEQARSCSAFFSV